MPQPDLTSNLDAVIAKRERVLMSNPIISLISLKYSFEAKNST